MHFQFSSFQPKSEKIEGAERQLIFCSAAIHAEDWAHSRAAAATGAPGPGHSALRVCRADPLLKGAVGGTNRGSQE